MPTRIFYVSPVGDDRWTGRLPEANAGKTDGPFGTLGGARDAIRRLKKDAGELKEAVTTQLRGGTYRLAETFQLRAEDSGTEELFERRSRSNNSLRYLQGATWEKS